MSKRPTKKAEVETAEDPAEDSTEEVEEARAPARTAPEPESEPEPVAVDQGLELLAEAKEAYADEIEAAGGLSSDLPGPGIGEGGYRCVPNLNDKKWDDAKNPANELVLPEVHTIVLYLKDSKVLKYRRPHTHDDGEAE